MFVLFWRIFIEVTVYFVFGLVFISRFYFIFLNSLLLFCLQFRIPLFFCCSVIWRRWGTLVQCCVTWPEVAIWEFTFAVITEPRHGGGVYLCGFILPKCEQRGLTLFEEPCFPWVSVTYCFYDTNVSCLEIFVVYFIFGSTELKAPELHFPTVKIVF